MLSSVPWRIEICNLISSKSNACNLITWKSMMWHQRVSNFCLKFGHIFFLSTGCCCHPFSSNKSSCTLMFVVVCKFYCIFLMGQSITYFIVVLKCELLVYDHILCAENNLIVVIFYYFGDAINQILMLDFE